MYWFSGGGGTVLYVGKAKNLKHRVTSYTRVTQLAPKTFALVQEATQLHFHVLHSELEALLVEAELIRTHQPHYNILLKDDKSPLYVLMTKEQFPRLQVLRKQQLQKMTGHARRLNDRARRLTGWEFGPFPSGYKLRQVLRLLRPIFPWCSEGGLAKRPCFYSHIGLCPGVCLGTVSAAEYGESMRQLRQFLHGHTAKLLTELKQRMHLAAEVKQFEQAGQLRDRIRLIQEVTGPQPVFGPDVVLPVLNVEQGQEMMIRLRRILAREFALPREFLPQRIECYDVSNTMGTKPVVSMVVFTAGQADKSQYRSFNIRLGETPNDYAMLQEALIRRQSHPEWGRPDLVVIDGGKGQLRTVLSVWQWANPVVSLAKEPDRLMMYQPGTKTFAIYELEPGELGGKLLQQLRDEAHRFAKKLHTRRRTQSVLE